MTTDRTADFNEGKAMTSSQEVVVGASPRMIMAISSVILALSIVVAVLLPASTDGSVGGPIGTLMAALAGIAMVVVWGAALWHAATVRPWTSSVPRWLMLLLLVFGAGVAGVLYYLLFARTYNPLKQTAR